MSDIGIIVILAAILVADWYLARAFAVMALALGAWWRRDGT